ncbi:hypothetical protein [Nostoc sp. DedQUE09]|uniref:hypothetical protein n=1 Tax=Nostoc sp. DedQUE09 TaxID=3075394 RepID=UPI002AD5564C|nr:hypothetical protein [Nostoc sp. DedQUE09]MDZ7954863.1 hypothetical protein [Nostoc sp. DedQUE09]
MTLAAAVRYFSMFTKTRKAIKPTSSSPAKELCSDRTLYTHSIDYVKQACAFINQQIG